MLLRMLKLTFGMTCMTPTLLITMSRHGKRAKNKDLLVVLIKKEDKAELRKLAAAENRTLSNYALTILLKETSRK